jgi:hypothetical protein
VQCAYRIWSRGLTCSLPFWVTSVHFNKMLAACEWRYVRHAYKYILYIPTYISIYLYNVIRFIINWEKRVQLHNYCSNKMH